MSPIQARCYINGDVVSKFAKLLTGDLEFLKIAICHAKPTLIFPAYEG